MRTHYSLVGVALVSVAVSFLVVFVLERVGIVASENVVVLFVLPLFVSPSLVAVASGYRRVGAASIPFVGLVPAVGAVIGLVAIRFTPEGIVGDGPIGLILLVVVIVGVVLAGFGVGTGIRVATN